jgi:hypothetical protein
MVEGTDFQKEFEKIKQKMIGASVRFPEKPDNPDEIGVVTDVYFQPAIDLDDKQERGPVFVSEDEWIDPERGEVKEHLGQKILCVIAFKGCVHITEVEDLILVDINER